MLDTFDRSPAPHSPAPAPRGELRRFGFVVGAAFVALALVALRRGGVLAPWLFGAAGAALLLFGLIAPARLRAVHRAWMSVALAMSKVTTPVFMALIYFGVLTPFGLVMRLLGRRPLARRRDAASYWVDRPAGARRGDMRRQF